MFYTKGFILYIWWNTRWKDENMRRWSKKNVKISSGRRGKIFVWLFQMSIKYNVYLFVLFPCYLSTYQPSKRTYISHSTHRFVLFIWYIIGYEQDELYKDLSFQFLFFFTFIKIWFHKSLFWLYFVYWI